MRGERFTAWITKYALTRGIFTEEVEVCSETMVKSVQSKWGVTFYHGDDYHRARSDAITRAEEMRAAKLASLQRQIDRLKRLDFSAAPRGGKEG